MLTLKRENILEVQANYILNWLDFVKKMIDEIIWC